MNTTHHKHWHLQVDDEQIVTLSFDKQDASVNTLNIEVMEELAQIIDTIAENKQYRGIILESAKQNGFIAGADITQFKKFKNIDEAVALLRLGQHIFAKLEALAIPSVAMIDGFCLGGGLELALACHYRVAEEGPKTRLGLPEVKLGIHPGWGGTVRLPRLIGGLAAMNLILSGQTVTAKVASKLGIIDAAVPRRHLKRAAKYFVIEKPKRYQPSRLQALTNARFIRLLLAMFMKRKLRAKINPQHYPAPFYALANWERISVESNESYENEAKSCGKLFFHETSENLVRVFFLQEQLKNLATHKKIQAKHLHVIGAGTMGGDIAAWCALRGMRVTLQDREPKLIAPAIKRAYQLFKSRLKEAHLIQKAMDNLIPDVAGDGLKRADIIIEAIFENLAAKQELFSMLEKNAQPHALLATNTSSIPLDEINTVMTAPERLVGIHFFNPVAKMQLVEIVSGIRTDAAITEQAINFVASIDKLPLPVKSSPGFLINRILMPYMLEGLVLLEEGVSAKNIDKAMVEFGMPMGPITLADTVGLDICLSVAQHLSAYFKTPIPQILTDKVAQGHLGCKTNIGFYHYKNNKQLPDKHTAFDQPLAEIAQRLYGRMLNEAFACLREGVVATNDLLDAGMIFATGFAPFTGGPIHFAKTQGIATLFEAYKLQLEKRGVSFDASQAWPSERK